MDERNLDSGFIILKRDFKNSRYALLLIGACLLFQKYVLKRVCPLVLFAGIPCPMCGLTRAGTALLKGDFQTAWEMHPFIYVIAVFFIVFCIGRYLFCKEAGWLKKYIMSALVLLVFFYLYRLFRYYPSEPPFIYEENNLMVHIWSALSGFL